MPQSPRSAPDECPQKLQKFHDARAQSCTSSLPRKTTIPLLLSRLLRIAAHNLDPLGLNVVLIVELEVDILDQKRPHLVTEAISIQMTLHGRLSASPTSPKYPAIITLKFMRALTLSPKTSVIDLSN